MLVMAASPNRAAAAFTNPPARYQGDQARRSTSKPRFMYARVIRVAVVFHDSVNAAIFSALMRFISLRSLADGEAPAIAIRVIRWATTTGAAIASCAMSSVILLFFRLVMVIPLVSIAMGAIPEPVRETNA